MNEEVKFMPYQEGKANRMTFMKVKERIVLNVKKTLKNGDDIGHYLETGNENQYGSLPVRLIADLRRDDSKVKRVAKLGQEQDGYDIIFAEQFRRYLDRKETFERNCTKTALIIFDYCNTTMQN